MQKTEALRQQLAEECSRQMVKHAEEEHDHWTKELRKVEVWWECFEGFKAGWQGQT